MSTDNQRMAIARNVLCDFLDNDTLSIAINYAKYTEVELVQIVMQNIKCSHRGYTVYRDYTTGPLIEKNDDPDNDLERDLNTCSMWISSTDKSSVYDNDYRYPLSYKLGVGNCALDIYITDITLNDLLPSAGMKTMYIPAELHQMFDICRLMYLRDTQSDMDAI